MITNTAPAKMVLQNSYAGYKTIYFQHSMFTDVDVYDRTFWITKPDNTTIRRDYTDVSRFSILLDGLTMGTAYRVQGAFVDAIMDDELIAAKFSLNLSDVATITTRVPPTITTATSIAQSVDVGVGAPIVVLGTAGGADYCIVEIQKVGTVEWEVAYNGALLNPIQFGGVPVGNYKVRITGHISMPDGVTIESSGSALFAGTLQVRYNFVPPSAPKNIAFRVANIKDGQERYDLRVDWEWEKLTGANVREFLLEYVNTAAFTASGWTKAQKINVGAAQQATLFSFPFNVEHKFRVSSIAWGPDQQSITQSTVSTFIITDNTPIDNSFTTETGIEVNYAHILGKLKNSSNVWQQTFLIDAKTGAVEIGLLDAQGKAPISFDPIRRNVNVDGRIITKIINAASFVLTNLTGEENPALYTQGKAYGDTNAGVFIGMDNTTLKPKVDIGNATQWIRYDGNTLRISSGVVIGTPNGDLPIDEGIQGNQTVFIYKLGTTTVPTKPTATNYPPSGWLTLPPNRTSQTDNIFACTGTIDPKTNKLVVGTSWSDVVQWSGTSGTSGTSALNGYLTNETVTVPASTAGAVSSFAGATGNFKVFYGTTDVTSGCSFTSTAANVTGSINAAGAYSVTAMTTGTAVLSGTLTMVANHPTYGSLTKVFTVTKSLAGASGSSAVGFTVNATGLSFSYNAAGVLKSAANITLTGVKQNTTAASTWSAVNNAGTAVTLTGTGDSRVLSSANFGSANYVTITAVCGGITETTTIVRLVDGTNGANGANGSNGAPGAAGANGARGPGFYVQSIAGLAAWNDASANSFFSSLFGSGPVRYDVLTQYNSSNVTKAFTRQWNGSAWAAPALVVHGDMIVTGTITSNKLVADYGFFAQIGVNVIYNRAAALTTTPENSYTMKIDLANSYIHIR